LILFNAKFGEMTNDLNLFYFSVDFIIKSCLFAVVGPTTTTEATTSSTEASTTAGLKLLFFVDSK